MELVSLSEIMADAHRRRYAVGAFNVSNMEMVRSLLEAAEELRAPVIVAATMSELTYAGDRCLRAMVESIGRGKRVVAALPFRRGKTRVMI